MWFYPLIGLLIVLCIVGGTLLGGVFTIVLIPLAVIAVVSALTYALIAGSARQSAASETNPSKRSTSPATRTSQTGTPPAPTTPEQVADARRARQ